MEYMSKFLSPISFSKNTFNYPEYKTSTSGVVILPNKGFYLYYFFSIGTMTFIDSIRDIQKMRLSSGYALILYNY